MASKGNISIPSELVTEILYRLPSKSVGRFRCVSKEWLSLLSSPQFIRTHQNTLNRNYFIFRPSSTNTVLYFIPFNYHEDEEEESVPTKFQLPVANLNLIICGSCNGLVLLSTNETLVISNPITREFVSLPDCDLKIKGHKFVTCFMRELGYDSVTDDYKVVTINQFLNLNGHDIITCVHVYSLRRNIWTRVIDYPDKYLRDYILSTTVVNGSFYWVATNTKVSDQTKVIVAFSLAAEIFSEVPLPMLGNDVLCKACKVVGADEKLAIFSVFESEVWLMNEYGVKGSWTKITLHGLNKFSILSIRFVFYVNGKLVLVCDWELLIYDTEDGRLSKRIDYSGYTYMRAFNFKFLCVESLVSPRFYRLS